MARPLQERLIDGTHADLYRHLAARSSANPPGALEQPAIMNYVYQIGGVALCTTTGGRHFPDLGQGSNAAKRLDRCIRNTFLNDQRPVDSSDMDTVRDIPRPG